MITATSDFTGPWSLAVTKNTELAGWIDFSEKKYLSGLLGVFLYQQFDLKLQKFSDLVNGATYEITGKTKGYAGLRDALKGLVYYQFVHNEVKHTASGLIDTSHSNGEPAEQWKVNMSVRTRYNEAVRVLCGAHDFILNTRWQTRTITSSVDNGDGTWTIHFLGPKYLEDATQIVLGSDTLPIIDKSETTITIKTTSQNETTFKWDVWPNWDYTELKIITI